LGVDRENVPTKATTLNENGEAMNEIIIEKAPKTVTHPFLR